MFRNGIFPGEVPVRVQREIKKGNMKEEEEDSINNNDKVDQGLEML